MLTRVSEKFVILKNSMAGVAASGPSIWTSTYGLEPVLCNRLLIEQLAGHKPFTC